MIIITTWGLPGWFFAAEQDWTGYTKEQREEMTANKTAEIYKELKVKCGFRW